ncbi:hypothetical protein FIBSPDRAFT_242466 [Athelia psychrophila]|uniref:Uncharacterized protein n=1 Tax=Athelia psychrophila TaxID=1759441 RepID=A0A165Y5Q8_9AGAM|nr:hypothetical protein FIBSPDRAFT_242466 [Fibularhizoctonia sp. CBS 109695]
MTKSRKSRLANKTSKKKTSNAGPSAAGPSGNPDPVALERARDERRKKRAAYLEEQLKELEVIKTQGNDLFRQGEYLAAAAEYLRASQLVGGHPVCLSNVAAAFLKLEE